MTANGGSLLLLYFLLLFIPLMIIGPVQAPCAHLCRPQRLNVQLCPNWRDYKQPFTDQTIAMENTPENGIVEDTGYILDDMSQGSTLNQFDMH